MGRSSNIPATNIVVWAPPQIYIFRFVWEWGTSNCEGLSRFCLYFIIKTWACTFRGTPIQSPAIPSVLGKFQDTRRSWPDLVRPQSLEDSTIQNLNKFMMIMMVHGPNHVKQLENNDKDIAKQSFQKKVPEKSPKNNLSNSTNEWSWWLNMTQHHFKK